MGGSNDLFVLGAMHSWCVRCTPIKEEDRSCVGVYMFRWINACKVTTEEIL